MPMIAKYFERIGDHAVNAAGWAIYSITGEGKDNNTMACPAFTKGRDFLHKFYISMHVHFT